MTEELFFSFCEELEKTYTRSMWVENDTDWPESRKVLYINGPLHGLYREHSELLGKMLDGKADSDRIISFLLKLKQEDDRDCKKKIIDVLGKERYKELCMKKGFIRDYSPLKPENIISWMNEYNSLILEDLKEESDQRRLMFLQLYCGYKEYRNRKSTEKEFSQEDIKEIYKTVLSKSSDFGKYELIPVSDQRILLVCDPPRIYDRVVNKTIFLYLNRTMAEIIAKLNMDGYIKKSSYRGRNDLIFDGRIDEEYICEAVERGRIFSLNIFSIPAITKLYSTETEYSNQLWVIKDDNSIIFEELCDDGREEKFVKTQLIHLMYKNKDGKFYISHLDHEFIYYTPDEFRRRKNNAYEKGHAHMRVKTFKLDESEIPLDYECEMFVYEDGKIMDKKIYVPLLYFVLNAYFEHKDLVREYFEDVLSRDG